jgi:hypothetical protein
MRRVAPLCTIAALGAGLAAPAWAQSQYQHNVSMPTGLEYDSNPRLTADDAGGVYRLRLSPSYTLLRKAGADELRLKLGAVVEQSSDTALSRNRQDGNAQVEWRREADAMFYVLRAAYEQSAARAALLEETGQLSDDGTRTTRSLGATLVRELDVRHSLSGGVDLKWSRYDFGRTPDNRLASANLEWSRALAPGQEGFVSGNVSHYAPDAASVPGLPASSGQSTLQRGVMVGYRSQEPGGVWNWSVRAGVASYNGPFSDTSAQGEARLGYEGQRWSGSASVSHMPMANNLLGSFAPNTQARLRAEYRLTEFTRVAIDASHNRTKASQTDATRQLGLQVSTELSPQWRVSAQLRHTQVDRRSPTLASQASSRTASLVFTYLHPDF